MFLSTTGFAQHEITVQHAMATDDFIEISIKMNKPFSKFHLIEEDTLILTDNRGNLLKENKEYPLNYNYNNGANTVSRYYPPKYKVKRLKVKGRIKYFRPSKEHNSYFDLGTAGAIKRNVNLVAKNILAQNPELYFCIADSTMINRVFPGFTYKLRDSEPYRKIDFSSFDLIYAYRYTDHQKIVYFINNDPAPGYNNLTLKDKKTGIMYVLSRIKRGITPAERDAIHVEIMIENEASVQKIPFELDNIKPEKL